MKVVEEIVETERTYLNGLKLVKSTYISKFKTAKVSFPSWLEGLMNQIPTLIFVHEQFFKELTQAIKNFDNDTSEIGPVFHFYIPQFKMYSQYVNIHDENKLEVATIDEHPLIQELVPHALDITGQNLSSLLVTPVQRPTRYEILLKQLIAHTEPDHPDYSSLQSAYNEILKINTVVNESIADAQKRRTTSKILTELNMTHLHQPSTIHIKKTICNLTRNHVALGKYECHLFSDVFLYTTGKDALFTLQKHTGVIRFQKHSLRVEPKGRRGLLLSFLADNVFLEFDTQDDCISFQTSIDHLHMIKYNSLPPMKKQRSSTMQENVAALPAHRQLLSTLPPNWKAR